MNRLEENYSKLRSEVTTIKYMLFISMLLTIVIAVLLLIYALKLDISNSMDQQDCHIHDL